MKKELNAENGQAEGGVRRREECLQEMREDAFSGEAGSQSLPVWPAHARGCLLPAFSATDNRG